MTRKEFYEWLKTCPAHEINEDDCIHSKCLSSNLVEINAEGSGYRVLDDYGEVKVHFWFEEAEEDNELIQEFKRLPKPIQRRIILKDREMHNKT